MPMKNHLQQLCANTWIFPQDPGKDRPNLGYVRGEKMALAIDAGHSSSHVEDFYEALDREGLPLPDLTVITHWHWDHTYGMHAVHGRTIARPETNRHLLEIAGTWKKIRGYGKKFLKSDPSIIREYRAVPLSSCPCERRTAGGQDHRPGRHQGGALLYRIAPHGRCPSRVCAQGPCPLCRRRPAGRVPVLVPWTLTKWPTAAQRQGQPV